MTTVAGESSSLLTHLASHRHCTERIQGAWPAFLSKREQRLEQQRRLGTAHEKVAENILEDLFTCVLDWPLSNVNNQVDFADIVLTDHGIKWLIVEVKRPDSLAWNRRAVQSALDQALRYAAEQKVRTVAVSDGEMLYAANIVDGGLEDRVFVRLCDPEPPLALWWLSVQGIWRNIDSSEGAALRFLPEEPVGSAAKAGSGFPSDTLLHPKYKLPAHCFAYVGNYAKVTTWKLPYLLADGMIDAKRLPKAVQCISVITEARKLVVFPRTPFRPFWDVLHRRHAALDTCRPKRAIQPPSTASCPLLWSRSASPDRQPFPKAECLKDLEPYIQALEALIGGNCDALISWYTCRTIVKSDLRGVLCAGCVPN